MDLRRRFGELPVGCDAVSGLVCVVDAGGADLDLPFFSDTVEGLARRGASARLIPVLDFVEMVDPGPIPLHVFHVGRAGSTLFSRGLQELGRTLVLREPEVASGLVGPTIAGAVPRDLIGGVVEWFRLFAAERDQELVVKWPSVASSEAPRILDLVPSGWSIGVVRDPTEVIESFVRESSPSLDKPGTTLDEFPRIASLMAGDGRVVDRSELAAAIWVAAVDSFVSLRDAGRMELLEYGYMVDTWPLAAEQAARRIGSGALSQEQVRSVGHLLSEDVKRRPDRATNPTGGAAGEVSPSLGSLIAERLLRLRSTGVSVQSRKPTG